MCGGGTCEEVVMVCFFFFFENNSIHSLTVCIKDHWVSTQVVSTCIETPVVGTSLKWLGVIHGNGYFEMVDRCDCSENV